MPRIKGYQHDANTRAKIQGAAIINRLHKIGMGEVDANPAQVNALKTLLNKVLPDLQSVALSSDEGGFLADILRELKGEHELPRPVDERVH